MTLTAVAAALAALPGAGAAGGDLDATFGAGGKVVTDFGASDHAFAVVAQRDGKIVAAGLASSPSGSDLALARYNSDGTLDASFDGDGRARIDLGGSEWASDAAVQRDGKIVVVGDSLRRLFVTRLAFVARIARDGSLDRSFGGDGIACLTACFTGSFSRALLQPDGKIVAVGSQSRIVLARYRPNGTLDPTFGRDGVVLGTAGVRVGDAALTSDGRIVVAATRMDARKQRSGDGFPIDLVVHRYRADGTPDRSFSGDGRARFDLRRTNCCVAEAVAVRRDGRIVIGGYGELTGGAAVMRLRRNGTRDFSFGRGGQSDSGAAGAGVGGLAVDRRGRVVVATRLGGSDFAVLRLRAGGDVDRLFSTDTGTRTDFGAVEDAWAIALQPDGKVVVGGYTGRALLDPAAPNDFALARYLGR